MVLVKTARQKKNHIVKKIQKTVKNRGALINTICLEKKMNMKSAKTRFSLYLSKNESNHFFSRHFFENYLQIQFWFSYSPPRGSSRMDRESAKCIDPPTHVFVYPFIIP